MQVAVGVRNRFRCRFKEIDVCLVFIEPIAVIGRLLKKSQERLADGDVVMDCIIHIVS
jgi:hypothetical protein